MGSFWLLRFDKKLDKLANKGSKSDSMVELQTMKLSLICLAAPVSRMARD